jgi:predicted ferric reductase/mono/diheme cytochrome c family protein
MTPAASRGPIVLVVICAIPLVLWLRAAPVEPRFSTSTLALTSAAVLCAFAGTAAFAMNLVLGARIRPVEKLFGGLERMYRIHRENGQIAFALLAAHAFLIFASRVTVSVSSGFDLVTPRAGLTIFSGFVALTLMGVALVLTLFVRLGQEVFVYVQRAFGFVFLLATYHVFTTQNGAKALSPALNWYTVALATAGIAAFAYRSLFHNVLVHRTHYTVEAANRLDEFVTEIVLEPRSKPLVYRPGQFVFVSFRSQEMRAHQRAIDISLERQVFSIRAGEIGNQFHPFSITSAPDEENLRITVKAVGDYTSALRRLEPGAEAVVEGPFGSFSNEGLRQPRQIWVAGGIGVTPFLSMARSLGRTAAPMRFYYCVERLEEAHFLREFQAIAAGREGFELTVVPRDSDGFLSAERLAAESPDLAETDVLICGPPAMIVSLRSQLVAQGLPESRIHAEEFGFAKRGPEASRAPLDLPEPSEHHYPTASRLPGVLSALAFAVFAFAGGVLVGQSRSSGGGATTTTAVDTSPAAVAAGKAVYRSSGCGACHVLAAAGSTGRIGPSLDAAKPDAARVVDLVTHGEGVMPAYRKRLTALQIDHVAAFVSTSAGG